MYLEHKAWHFASADRDAEGAAPDAGFAHAPLYRALLAQPQPDAATRRLAAQFLRQELALAAQQPCELPESPHALEQWMQAGIASVHNQYRRYLEQRKAGAARAYFSNRAHALAFLRAVAPTKLVDGAWLHGVLADAEDPRRAHLVQTYLEELGCGDPSKNHVVLYRKLLAQHGLESPDGLEDGLYRQGLIQLALGCSADEFLPEVIGFNLGYEQLPLHLLITAYELDELGIDPYYFTLHVTVDNADTGHARRACQAVLDNMPSGAQGEVFWRRVREASKLAGAGIGTNEVIAGFSIERELLEFLQRKARVGAGAHSDYCRIGGRTVNEWLAAPHGVAGFLAALQETGWIRRGQAAQDSRFWNLLQGERAPMFGVFSGYELQLLHDWIRADASADGRPYFESPGTHARRLPFRAAARLQAGVAAGHADCAANDASARPTDAAMDDRGHDGPAVGDCGNSARPRSEPWLQALSPARHWTPSGMRATRRYCASLGQ